MNPTNPQSLENNPFAHLLNPYADEDTQPPTQGLENNPQHAAQGLETKHSAPETPLKTIQAWLETQPPHTRLETLHTLIETTLPTLQPEENTTHNPIETLHTINQAKKNFETTYTAWRTHAWKLLGASKGTTDNGVKYTFTAPKPRIQRKINWTNFRAKYPEIYAAWVQETVTVAEVGTLRMS